jgi:hypothetical protein
MRNPLVALVTVACLLTAGLASADIIKDRRWIKGPDTTDTYIDWKAIESTVECGYGPWQLAKGADGSRTLTRTKACHGTETVNLGVLPE